MTPRRRREPSAGFTLIELAVVIAIVAILSTIAYSSLARNKPRANLASAAVELQALLHEARQSALASGEPVAVLFYPGYSGPGTAGATGYVIVYQDACFDFFTGGGTCGVAYGTYDPALLAAGTNGALQSAVLDTMSLPTGVAVGPAAAMGAGARLPAPLAGVPVDAACAFCGTTGGAVRFDPRGQASFYGLSGTTVTGPLPLTEGASLSLGFDPAVAPDMSGQRTLVILSASGAVQAINGG